ncbi:MAG: ABC transporter permease [Lachnospiraceae bacterium]|nr:ABC transporter permease [Lachnospiraceae bacterium]
MKKSSNNIYSCEGISKVFAFTLAQTFKNRTYRMSFILFIVMMMLMGPINYLGASAGMNAAESSDAINDEMDLKRILFVNTTYIPFTSANAELADTGFGVAELTDAEAVPEHLADDEIAVLIDRQKGEEQSTYMLNAIVSDHSNITAAELDALCDHLLERFAQARREVVNLGDTQMEILQKGLQQGSVLSYEDYEAELNATYTNRQISSYNMLYSIILMILVALTGSYVVSSVMEEKTSKLVENLMVSVRPLALIMGKILAMMCYVFSMIVIGAALSYVSNTIMESITEPSISREVGGMLNFSRLFTFAGAKGILMLPCMILTYFMYSILAGLLGSACTRTEDASSAIGAVTMLNMAGYMVGVIVPNVENHTVTTVVSILPFVSSYVAPVGFICGRVPLWAFLLGVALQIVICVLLFLICARTYRKLIVNDSKRLRFSEIMKMAFQKEVA